MKKVVAVDAAVLAGNVATVLKQWEPSSDSRSCDSDTSNPPRISISVLNVDALLLKRS